MHSPNAIELALRVARLPKSKQRLFTSGFRDNPDFQKANMSKIIWLLMEAIHLPQSLAIKNMGSNSKRAIKIHRKYWVCSPPNPPDCRDEKIYASTNRLPAPKTTQTKIPPELITPYKVVRCWPRPHPKDPIAPKAEYGAAGDSNNRSTKGRESQIT